MVGMVFFIFYEVIFSIIDKLEKEER